MANLQCRLFSRSRIFLPFHLHPAAFLLRVPLEACFFGHTVDTPHTRCKFFAPILWLFYISFVKTVCKGILGEFPLRACKIPLSLVREMHAAEYLRRLGEKPISKPDQLFQYVRPFEHVLLVHSWFAHWYGGYEQPS